MRILLLTMHLRMGGVPIYVVTLAKALKGLKHDVCVFSGGGDLAKRLKEDDIPHAQLDMDTKSELHPKLLIGIYHLYWYVKEKDIEIIHTNTRVAQVMGTVLSFLTGARHVSTCHGFFKLRLSRRLFDCWGKKVIAISEAVREHLVNDFRIKKRRIELIHNGIDLDAFKKVYSDDEKKNIKEEFELKSGPVVGIIARLSSIKGHRFLIKAMKTVTAKIKDAQLLVVGEGKDEPDLKNLVKELKLSNSVVFTKTVLDTSRVLPIIDIFVLPSLREGLGLVLLEALCSGTPVIASDAGGVYSVVKDNVTGILVSPKNSEDLAKAILRLFEDEELRQRLVANGQKFVCEKFSLDKMVKKVEKVYKEVVV